MIYLERNGRLLSAIIVCKSLALLCCCLQAQALVVVSLSGVSPSNSVVLGGTSAVLPIACFRFEVSGGNADITNIVFSTQGTGNWFSQLASTTGVRVYEDDGDGVFSTFQDTLLFSGSGASPTRTCALSPTLSILDLQFKDIWFVIELDPSAGTAIPSTFSVDIQNGSDVTITQPSGVMFGNPPPTGNLLEVVLFSITTLSPLQGRGGDYVTLVGSGFVAPVTINIGGVNCGGSASISADRTSVTGLWYQGKSAGLVPNQAVTVTTGLSGTLATAFLFTELSDVDGNGGTQDDSACSLSEPASKHKSSPTLPVALILGGGWYLARMRRNRRSAKSRS